MLALLKQGISHDFDRPPELVDKQLDIERILRLTEEFGERRFAQRTLVRIVGC